MKKKLALIFGIIFLMGFVVAQGNETNQTTGTQDLIITKINLFDRNTNQDIGFNITTNQAHYIHPTIKNIGTLPVILNNLKYSIAYDQTGSNINLLMSCSLINLEPNQEFTCTPQGGYLAVSSNGLHELKLKIDYNNVVDEIDETNNEFTTTIFSEGRNQEPIINQTNNSIQNNTQSQTQQQNQTQIRNQTQQQTRAQQAIQTQNRLQIHNQTGECPANCSCQGSVIQCQMQNGRQMTIQAGKSGNTIVQTKGQNISTNVELYTEGGIIYGQFKGGKTKAINLMPDQIQEKLQQKINSQLDEELEIELDENGFYQVQAKKQARFLRIFRVQERIRIKFDPETGEMLQIRNSWWGFLAKDVLE